MKITIYARQKGMTLLPVESVSDILDALDIVRSEILILNADKIELVITDD
jgi:hypothetical protein